MSNSSVFEYFYRDASNFKAWGTLLLRGVATEADVATLKSRFESGDYFIAEQLNVPTLYAELWKFSDGPTENDHVFHTFHALRPMTPEDAKTEIFDTVESFVLKVKTVKEWDYALSPHY